MQFIQCWIVFIFLSYLLECDLSYYRSGTLAYFSQAIFSDAQIYFICEAKIISYHCRQPNNLGPKVINCLNLLLTINTWISTERFIFGSAFIQLKKKAPQHGLSVDSYQNITLKGGGCRNSFIPSHILLWQSHFNYTLKPSINQ